MAPSPEIFSSANSNAISMMMKPSPLFHNNDNNINKYLFIGSFKIWNSGTIEVSLHPLPNPFSFVFQLLPLTVRGIPNGSICSYFKRIKPPISLRITLQKRVQPPFIVDMFLGISLKKKRNICKYIILIISLFSLSP